MKKQFINPAVRVVKFENNMLCASGNEPNTINAQFHEGEATLAPTRHGVFGEDSEF